MAHAKRYTVTLVQDDHAGAMMYDVQGPRGGAARVHVLGENARCTLCGTDACRHVRAVAWHREHERAPLDECARCGKPRFVGAHTVSRRDGGHAFVPKGAA